MGWTGAGPALREAATFDDPGDRALSGSSPPCTLVSLKVDGIDVKSFGLLKPTHPEQELIQSADEPPHEHRALILEGTRIVGAIFVGPTGVGKFIGTIIQANLDVSPILPDLRR